MKKFYKKLFVLFLSFIIYFIMKCIFSPIFNAPSLIFPYSVTPFDIVAKYPIVWSYIKKIYCITFFLSTSLLTNTLISNINFPLTNFFSSKPQKTVFKPGINLLIGKNSISQEEVYICEKSLYQNILITGTIGSRQNKFFNGTFAKTTYFI